MDFVWFTSPCPPFLAHGLDQETCLLLCCWFQWDCRFWCACGSRDQSSWWDLPGWLFAWSTADLQYLQNQNWHSAALLSNFVDSWHSCLFSDEVESCHHQSRILLLRSLLRHRSGLVARDCCDSLGGATLACWHSSHSAAVSCSCYYSLFLHL